MRRATISKYVTNMPGGNKSYKERIKNNKSHVVLGEDLSQNDIWDSDRQWASFEQRPECDGRRNSKWEGPEIRTYPAYWGSKEAMDLRGADKVENGRKLGCHQVIWAPGKNIGFNLNEMGHYWSWENRRVMKPVTS